MQRSTRVCLESSKQVDNVLLSSRTAFFIKELFGFKRQPAASNQTTRGRRLVYTRQAEAQTIRPQACGRPLWSGAVAGVRPSHGVVVRGGLPGGRLTRP